VFAAVLILLVFALSTTVLPQLDDLFGVEPKKVSAATSGTINFQARLQNAAGNIAPDGSYNVEFKLYNVSSGGSALWTSG
jgi:flagellar hook assembly protein FlgD